MVASPFEKIEAQLTTLEKFLKVQVKLNRKAAQVNESVERHLTKRIVRLEHHAEQQMEINVRVKAQLDNFLKLLKNQQAINRAIEDKLGLKG